VAINCNPLRFPPDARQLMAVCIVSSGLLVIQPRPSMAAEIPVVVCDLVPLQSLAVLRSQSHSHHRIRHRMPSPEGVKATGPAIPHPSPRRQANLPPAGSRTACRSLYPIGPSPGGMGTPVGWAPLGFLTGVQRFSPPVGAYSPIPSGSPSDWNSGPITPSGPTAGQTASLPPGAIQSLYPPNLPISLPFGPQPSLSSGVPPVSGSPGGQPPDVTPVNVTVAEPSTLSIFLFGMIGLWCALRRRSKIGRSITSDPTIPGS
jgi:hypothetical protein